MELSGQQSSQQWNNTNDFDQHIVKMWTDYCHLWNHSSASLFATLASPVVLQYAAEGGITTEVKPHLHFPII